jgi:hypothetical protein
MGKSTSKVRAKVRAKVGAAGGWGAVGGAQDTYLRDARIFSSWRHRGIRDRTGKRKESEFTMEPANRFQDQTTRDS